MKKIILIIAIFLCLGCQSNKTDIKQLMKDNEYVILDVRTKEEYDALHVKDAINIPLDEIKTIDISKDKIIFVYCKSGNRSKQAYNYLKSIGYEVYDLKGIDSIDMDKE